MSNFDVDPFRNRPKILFVGWPNSPHTHSWVNLLKEADFNVRVFCLNSTEPPEDWWVKCYQTVAGAPFRDDDRRRTVFPVAGTADLEEALARVIREWHPDILHTLGLDPSAFLYRETLKRYDGAEVAAWVAQARGGSDTALPRYSPSLRPIIEDIFLKCDHFIADNAENYEFAQSAGLAKSKITKPGMGVVPGPGGLDLEAMRARWIKLPSQRERLIVWPKAYETPWAKANPVFEGILNAWEKIKPCRIEMLWLDNPYLQMWYQKLFSEELRQSCVAREQLPHEEALDLFSRARVMLAPSLIDGVPNSMMEAMALGAVPIVSPIETIVPVAENGKNVIFARNLYPDEIAEALVKAMSDDDLVDHIATNNVVHVRRLADRAGIRKRAINFYNEAARKARQMSPLTINHDVQRRNEHMASTLGAMANERKSKEEQLAVATAHRLEQQHALDAALEKAWRDEILRVARRAYPNAGTRISKWRSKIDGRSMHHEHIILASGLFNEAYYSERNPDVAAYQHGALIHFLHHGGTEGRRPGPDFDSSLYLAQNPDVVANGINPLVHFILYGLLEGRGEKCVNRAALVPGPPL